MDGLDVREAHPALTHSTQWHSCASAKGCHCACSVLRGRRVSGAQLFPAHRCQQTQCSCDSIQASRSTRGWRVPHCLNLWYQLLTHPAGRWTHHHGKLESACSGRTHTRAILITWHALATQQKTVRVSVSVSVSKVSRKRNSESESVLIAVVLKASDRVCTGPPASK